MPKDLTGSGAAWKPAVTVPLDGEPIQMVGPGGAGNERTYQTLSDRDAYILTQVSSVESDVTTLDDRVTALETQPVDGGSY